MARYHDITFPKKGVPGQVVLTTDVFQDGDSAFQVTDASGQRKNGGVRLADLRKMPTIVGDVLSIVDPYVGDRHNILLTSWAEADPEKTFIRISFMFVPA